MSIFSTLIRLFDHLEKPLTHGLIRLDREESQTLAYSKAVELICIQGDVWLTCDGFGGELRLKGGQSARLVECRNVIVTALAPTVLDIRPAENSLRQKYFWARVLTR